ncbi:MAG TPA: hypothetical protein VGV37_18510 [Aliidongia sp.]|uniref:hypothetical protein n=1 Tax=Aliidongia sp. TaxID=1914230 RepID=UPI002DDCBC79|nr:hypothetical protein [Aliidongia sp.]HEV2676525.1 hypothetical protein [Aliidongia sp.]
MTKDFSDLTEQEILALAISLEEEDERFGDHIPLIRHRFMETPIWSAAFQVVFGGALVFATGIVIGSS